MEYLKAFTIGSSGLVIFPLLSSIANDSRYEYSKKFPLTIPIYYGLMSMLALYIGTNYKLPLQHRFLIVSIISILIILVSNHYLNDKYYTNTKQNNLFLVLQDIIRQLIIFIVIFYLTENFSKSVPLKIFIIGSSMFSYYINYYLSLNADILKYDPKYFVITEPFVQGCSLMIGLYIGINYFKLNLLKSYIIYNIISTLIMVMIAKYLELYVEKYHWTKYNFHLLMSGFMKMFIYFYLIKNLK